MKVWFALLATVVSVVTAGAGQGGLDEEANALRGRLTALSHGTYPRAEWEKLFGQLDALAARAGEEDRTDLAIELRVVKAMVLSQGLARHADAAEILERVRASHAGATPELMRKVYVRLAEVYARQGREQDIETLIDTYSRGPLFDPEQYAYRVGEGRDTPIAITRPGAGADSSVTVTAMRNALKQARRAPGRPAPDFEVVTRDGRKLRLSGCRGQVVLVDFWQPNWPGWVSRLPHQCQVYERYRERGFEVLGVAIDPDVAHVEAFLARRALPWPVFVGAVDVPRSYGVYGEATNVLVGHDGIIVGSDLYGGELVACIRAALERGELAE